MRLRHISNRLVALSAFALFALPAVTVAQSLTGAGASFPDPIYKKWFSEHNKKTGVQINYQAAGSSAGIRQFTAGTVDFGATDGPMTAEQMTAVKGQVVHIPTVLGAVVVTYNLPAVGQTPLKLSGTVIADIFLGKITKWNDRALTALNPGVALPSADILVVRRSDGSGTTFIFTDFLSKISPDWKAKVGTGQSVNWPVGLGGTGNAGVTQQVRQTPGSIGYVELVYAEQNKLPSASIMNSTGAFIRPSLEAVTAAAGSAKFDANTDFRVSITNAPGAKSYPISSFTWLLINPQNPDPAKGKVLKEFLTWMITPEAQNMAASLTYAPLPPEVIALVAKRIEGFR